MEEFRGKTCIGKPIVMVPVVLCVAVLSMTTNRGTAVGARKGTGD